MRVYSSLLDACRNLALPILMLACLSASSAFSQTEGELDGLKKEVDAATKELTGAQKDVTDNTPGGYTAKKHEDDLDAAARRNEDVPAGDPAKETTQTAETDAKAAADDEGVRGTELDQARLNRYREALKRRREARKKLKELLAKLAALQAGARPRREAAASPRDVNQTKKKIEDEIKEAEAIPPRRTLAALSVAPGMSQLASRRPITPFGPITANVAMDSQTYCTFGKAGPGLMLFTPTDAPLMSDVSNSPTAQQVAGLPSAGLPVANAPPKAPDPPTAAPKGDGSAAAGPPAGPGGNPADQPPEPAGKPRDPVKATDKLPRRTGPPQRSSGGPPPRLNDGSPAPDPASHRTPSVLDDIDKVLEAINRGKTPQDASGPAGGPPPSDPTQTPGAGAGAGDPSGKPPTWIGPLPPELKYGLPNVGVTSKGSDELGPSSPGASLEPIPSPPAAGAPGSAEAQPGTKPTSPPDTAPAPETGAGPADAASRNAAATLRQFGIGESREIEPAVPPSLKLQTVPSVPFKDSILEEIDEVPVIASTPKAPPIQASAASPVPSQVATGLVGGGPASAIDANPDAARSTNSVTLDFKATESVLTGLPDLTKEIKQQLVKLVPLEKPASPKAGTTRTARAEQDTGYDKPPVQCVTDVKGECRAEIQPEERETYGFPKTGSASYRADVMLPQNSGGVVQRPAGSPRTKLPDDVPAGAKVTMSEFKIGKVTVTRLSYAAPSELIPALTARHSQSFGKSYQTDHCGEKKPGPPLGMEPVSFSGLNRELPEATIVLGGFVQAHEEAQ